MNIGFATNTVSTQYWLNGSAAVSVWVELNANWIEFQFDSAIEEPVVPPGVYFDADAIPADAPEIPAHEIDFGTLRSCLAQIGCADVEAVVDWFEDSVDEQDAMRRSSYCYVALAENLNRWYVDEQEANAESLANANDEKEAAQAAERG